ncbi:MAG: hypothetical protein WA977_02370 [Halobacteriota archaeon]
MVYAKTTWVNDSSPDIDETNLNNIEDGIYKAQDFDSGEHIGDLPATRFSTNIEAAIAGKNIVPDTIVINNVTDEAGSLKIYGKDSNVLILGDATHEGGDVKIYRDTSGNLQFSIDADAASNAKAVDIYGGVVVQHYLTVGTTSLSVATNFYVAGTGRTSSTMAASAFHADGGLVGRSDNIAALPLNIRVSGTNATDHAVKMQIDATDIFVVQATGDGAGGITLKAIGAFGVTPQVQQAHIADVAAAAGDPPTKAEFDAFAAKFNQLKADIEGFGFNAAS